MRADPAEETDTSCDTLVILGKETRDGHTLFAKNSDWDAISEGVEALAAGPEWAAPDGVRLDFRRTVENPDLRYRAEARLAARCRFLAEDPQPGVASLMRHLRDHHEGGTVHVPGRRVRERVEDLVRRRQVLDADLRRIP